MQIVLEMIEDSDLGSLDLNLSIPAEIQHTLAYQAYALHRQPVSGHTPCVFRSIAHSFNSTYIP